MTTMTEHAGTGPSAPELQLLLAAAARASQAAVPPDERARQQVTDRLVGCLVAVAVSVAAYDVALVLR